MAEEDATPTQTPAPVATPTQEPAARPAAPAKPEGLDDKFWDGETGQVRTDALIKSQADGQRKITELTTPQADESALKIPGKDEPSGAPLAEDATINDLLQRADLKRDDVTKQFLTNDGKLTDEQYAALKKTGLPRAVVDEYLGSNLELAQRRQADIVDMAERLAGSDKQLQTVLGWAKTTFTTEEVAQFNQQFADPQQAQQAMTVLLYRYQQTVGGGAGAPNAGGGGGGGTDSATTAGFSDRAEMAAAQGDPRYGTHLANGNTNPKYNKSYTDQADRRLLNTPFINKRRR